MSNDLGFSILARRACRRQPVVDEPVEMQRTGTSAADYRRLDPGGQSPSSFCRRIRSTSRATSDDRPFFFHTTRLRDQMQVAFGRTMLFGNGLSALMTLMAISAMLVALFVDRPAADRRRARPGRGWVGVARLLRRARRGIHAAGGGAAAALRAAPRTPRAIR